MKCRTDNRKALVLAAIQSPRSASEVRVSLGITYGNAYYTLQALKFERLCHIASWATKGGNKPVASFIAGEGKDADVGGAVGQTKAEQVSVDAGLRSAVAAWVKSNGGSFLWRQAARRSWHIKRHSTLGPKKRRSVY